MFIALRGTTFLCTLLLFRVNFTEKVFPLKINQNMSLTTKYWAEKKKEEESRERTKFVRLKSFELVLEKFDVLAKNLNLVVFPSLLTCLQISNLIW